MSTLPPVIKKIVVPCGRQKAFDVFVHDIGSWWPLDRNSVSAMAGEVAREVTLEPAVGGKIVEIAHDGTEHQWGSVKSYQPPALLELNWHIGKPDSMASIVNVVFTELSATQTEVILTHSHWEVFAEQAEAMRNGYDNGWVGVFEQAYASACDPSAVQATGGAV